VHARGGLVVVDDEHERARHDTQVRASSSVRTCAGNSPTYAARSRRLLMPVAMLFAGGAAVMAWRSAAHETPVAAPSASVVTRSSANVPPDSPARIVVRATAIPPEARLYLDGTQLPTNPHSLTVPADGSHHVIRAEAAGYDAQRQDVLFDENISLVLTLQRAPVEAPRSEPAPRRSSHPAAQKAKCDPPFVIDARGVKKFKPECL